MSDVRHTMFFGQFGARNPKRLVEECSVISIGDVRRRLGKRSLLQAIRDCVPVIIPIRFGRGVGVWLTYDTHPLAGRPGQWSNLEDGTARVWFCCARCLRQRLAKLYFFVDPASGRPSEPLCRRCNNLTYLSVNCSGNRFYMRVVRPLRRLGRVDALLRSPGLRKSKRRALEAERASLRACLQETRKKYGRKTAPAPAAGGCFPTSFLGPRRRTYKSLELA